MKLKGKKIAFFVALPHHSRFLFPLAEAAKGEGADIFFFTTLVDYPFEKDFVKRNLKYKFLMEYADENTREKIKRATQKAFDEWSKINFTWHGFRQWSIFQQSRALIRNIEDYFFLEELIKREKPDMFVTLHEMNPWGKHMGHLSIKYDIPYVTLQEGDYYHGVINFSMATEYSTVSMIWGYTAAEMLSGHKCTPFKTVIIGNTHIDEAVKFYSTRAVRRRLKNELSIPASKKVITFMLNVVWGGVVDRAVWTSLLKDLKRADILCLFKWHPQVAYNTYEEIKKIIKEILPDSMIFFSEDPYKLLSISDYCIVMGKTTLGVEALAFNKPLFCLYNIIDGDEFYSDIGIAQSVSPAGNWNALFKTIEHGVPEKVETRVKEHLEGTFYKLDGKATERALKVIDFIFDYKSILKEKTDEMFGFNSEPVPGKVSFIILSGSDGLALLATLTSLSNNITYKDWEIILVVNNEEIKWVLSGLTGDVKVVEAQGGNQAMLFNEGARVSGGESLVFIKSGFMWYKSEGFIEAIKGGIAGIPLRNPDLSPQCLGVGFDFNFTPYSIKDEDALPDLVGGAVMGIDRALFESINGFDEEIGFYSIDFMLSALKTQNSVNYMKECMGLVYKNFPVEPLDSRFERDDWKKYIRFFTKWSSTIPREDNYLKHAEKMLKI